MVNISTDGLVEPYGGINNGDPNAMTFGVHNSAVSQVISIWLNRKCSGTEPNGSIPRKSLVVK